MQPLIDAVVQHTTVLIAKLATSGGLRAPLAHIANQVFLDLANELERQGVSRKVSADMFGLALRGYQRRIQRLTESSSARGRSLWEAVLEYVTQHGIRRRAQVLQRFSNDDEAIVRGVLHDLAESGLLFCSGNGANAAYRATTPDELGELRDVFSSEGVDELLWLIVFRSGPLARSGLEQRLKLSREQCDEAVGRLLSLGRLRETELAGEVAYASGEFYIPLGEGSGWAAAVLDHLQAVMKTISSKLDGDMMGQSSDRTGGSTYTFIVWPGHPHEGEVCGELARYRAWASALRARVDAYNREHGIPERYLRVVSYAGQCSTEHEDG